MASLVFQVQSMVSAGPDRVNVSLTQVDPNAAPSNGAPVPFYGASLNLNLSQDEAASYDVNQRYTLSLTAVAAPSSSTSTP
jgi:hypothetical protein